MKTKIELWIAGSIAEVISAARTGLPTAIVTNPTVMADWTSGGRTLESVIDEVTSATSLPLYVQLRGPDYETFLAEGEAYTAISDRVCLKLPSTIAGFAATRTFALEGKKTLVTTVCSIEQAYLAAAAGADAVCPYLSRLDESGESSSELVKGIREFYQRHECATRIFPASVRSREQIGEAVRSGANGVIVFYDLFCNMADHHVSEASCSAFETDWNKTPTEFEYRQRVKS